MCSTKPPVGTDSPIFIPLVCHLSFLLFAHFSSQKLSETKIAHLQNWFSIADGAPPNQAVRQLTSEEAR